MTNTVNKLNFVASVAECIVSNCSCPPNSLELYHPVVRTIIVSFTRAVCTFMGGWCCYMSDTGSINVTETCNIHTMYNYHTWRSEFVVRKASYVLIHLYISLNFMYHNLPKIGLPLKISPSSCEQSSC